MTTDTLAKLAAELAQLASEGPALIHTQSGAYISQKLSEAAKAIAAQAQVGGRCDECGKAQSEGWALYCVDCLEKTGLLAKEALPHTQHVSSTAADLTGPNDTAAQATTGGGVTTGAPSEPFGYFKAQPFGWTDCAEDDDGAIALYEQPASQFTGAFSGIAARKLADLADRGYRVNGYSLMHAETRARGFIDSGGFVGWWSNRDHKQAAQDTAGWVLVPIEPTEDQWGGLARDILMAFDMGSKTPAKLLDHLEKVGREIPQWLRDEGEMKYVDHVISKGTRAVIIYRAMLAAALPHPPQPQSAQPEVTK